MSISATEFEQLLREAIRRSKEPARNARDDLVRCASIAAEAVTQVTEGTAALELVKLRLRGDSTPTYRLQIRQIGSAAPPSDLGLYRLPTPGYPIQRWHSELNWEERSDRPDRVYKNLGELECHFKWLMSEPESHLVLHVAFLQQIAEAPSARAGSPS